MQKHEAKDWAKLFDNISILLKPHVFSLFILVNPTLNLTNFQAQDNQ